MCDPSLRPNVVIQGNLHLVKDPGVQDLVWKNRGLSLHL